MIHIYRYLKIELNILKVTQVSQYTVVSDVALRCLLKEIGYVGSNQISHRIQYLTRYLSLYTDI